MSLKVMTKVWECGPKPHGELHVLLALADFADDHGQCFPRMETIAEKARMTDRDARIVVRKLEANGWLTPGDKPRTGRPRQCRRRECV